LKSSWEKKLYIEVYTQEARRGIGWWKMGIWKLKGVRGITEQGMCPVCNKEGWSRILRCEETKVGERSLWTNDSQVLSHKLNEKDSYN
jgi:hypothetical protein